MNKLLAVIVASTFALCSAEGFGAGTVKLEDLTKEQRMDMRYRAEKLIAERAATANQTKAAVGHTSKVKKASRPEI